MDRRAVPLLLMCVLGCTSWRVVRQTDPCPYRGTQKFDLVDIVFVAGTAAAGKTAGFISRREAVDLWRIDEDRRVIRDGFLEAFIDSTGDAGIEITVVATATAAESRFVLRPRVTRLDPGGPTVADSMSSEVEVTLAVQERGGRVVDEIGVIVGTDPSEGTFDRDRRLRRGARLLGQRAARFIVERAGL